MGTKRFNVSCPSELSDRIDAYCKTTGIPRSSLVQIAITQYLDSVELMPDLKTMISALASVTHGALSGELSPDEAQKRLNSIEDSYSLITGKKSL